LAICNKHASLPAKNRKKFPLIAAKLGRFIIDDFSLYLTNTQTKQRKSENEENKFYRIGYRSLSSTLYIPSNKFTRTEESTTCMSVVGTTFGAKR